MIWPWSEIQKWKQLAEHHDERATQAQARAEMFRAECLNLLKTMTGAHKGIWRLRQKLKKYREEQVVTPSNFDPQLFAQAPCYLCGYNGEMYYQPTKHSCAKFYHRHVEEQG